MGKEICKAENHRYWKDRLRTEDQYRRAKKLGLVWDGEYTNNTFREGAGWVGGGGGVGYQHWLSFGCAASGTGGCVIDLRSAMIELTRIRRSTIDTKRQKLDFVLGISGIR